MPDFSVRATTPEWMDGPCDFETLQACLADLAQVNRLTLAYRPTLAFLARTPRPPHGAPLRILDVGCGYGDTLRRIEAWAREAAVTVELTGLDLNPFAVQAAQAASPPDSRIRWVCADIFAYEAEADVIVSALLTHHLSTDAVVNFVQWMERRAKVAWFVNDLHRQAFPYFGFALLARLMGWHPFVRHDGPVSIARAFQVADWRAILDRAGLPNTMPRRRFPFRLCVERIKP